MLDDLELASGPACAAMVDVVRALLERRSAVTRDGASRALDRVALVEVRWEEPAAA